MMIYECFANLEIGESDLRRSVALLVFTQIVVIGD